MDFWCTVIAYQPNPPTDDSEARPLKEYLFKFLVMNDKKPLTLDFKTFTEYTGLDYAKCKYVSHPSTREVKVELAKIVLGGNNSSTEKVNSIQQLFAYCLLTGTKDESFGSSLTILSNSYFSKDLSKVTPIELAAFMVAVNNNEKSVSPLPFTIKKKKGKSRTVTSTLPQSQGPEASGPLPQNRKKTKSKKPLTETKVTPLTGPTEGLPSTSLDEGIRKSQPLPEGTVKTTLLPEGPRGDKDSKGFIRPADMEPLTNLVVDPSGMMKPNEMLYESDDEDVFEAGEDIDKDTQVDEEEGSQPSIGLGLSLLCVYNTSQAILTLYLLLFISTIEGGAGFCEMSIGKGYRGDGEVGIGEGELGMVLGRWFGLVNHGKGWFEVGGKVG
ncbi:hypothetical protein Tco_0753086 [Tanacetum coccineum]